MKKFNLEDWDIEPELDVNKDDFIYGNYVEWDRFRDENEENLLDYFEIYLPWSKKLNISEYIEFIGQDFFRKTDLLDKYEFDKLSICKQGTNVSNLQIRFIDQDDIDSSSLISDIFDYYGVPTGTEYEQELPEELQYWSNKFDGDYEYEYYKSHPIKINDYKKTISEIQIKIRNYKDELVVKSLILSSLIVNESFIKSIVSNEIPEEQKISSFSKAIINDAIADKLKSNHSTRGLFKNLFGVKAPKQNWIQLRNSLAHDIESSELIEGEIKYSDSKGNICSYEIEELFKELFQFAEELEDIINK